MELLNFESLPESHIKEFFRKFATALPSEASFQKWLLETSTKRRMQEKTKRFKALAIAAGVTEVTVRHAFHERPTRRAHVGPQLHQTLALMGHFLGVQAYPLPPAQWRGFIVLLIELNVCSVRFHYEMTRSLVAEAARRGLALSVVGCTREEMADVVLSQQVRHCPDGYILLRLTPTTEALAVMHQTGRPVVLIHGDVLQYPPPVLANVIPDQSRVQDDLARWVADLKARHQRLGPPKVVVVAVRDENPMVHDFPPLDPDAPSIRNQRKRLIMEALIRYGVLPFMEVVQDYSSHHALPVYLRHPDADGFLCLSDSLAVAMKQHLIVAGQRWEGRVLGFDNTQLAHEEGISSFEQSRSETAELALDALTRYFASARPGAVATWPQSELVKVKMTLRLRPDPGAILCAATG